MSLLIYLIIYRSNYRTGNHTWSIPSTEKRREALKLFQKSSWFWPGSAIITTTFRGGELEIVSIAIASFTKLASLVFGKRVSLSIFSMAKPNPFSRVVSAGLVWSMVLVDNFVSEICKPLSVPVTSVFVLETWSTVTFCSVSGDDTMFQVVGIFTKKDTISVQSSCMK